MKQTKHILIYFLLLILFAISNEAKAESVTINPNNSNYTGLLPTGARFTVASTSSAYVNMSKGQHLTLTLKGFAGYKITKLTLEVHSDTKKGAGYLVYQVGNNDVVNIIGTQKNGVTFKDYWYSDWSTNYVTIEKNVSIIPSTNEDVKIIFGATETYIGCKSYTITYERPSLTIGSTGYATFCSADATDFSDTKLNVYTASVSGHVARLTKIESGQVAAGEGVIVRGPADTYSIPVIRSEIGKVTGNELVGTTEVTTVKKTSDGKYNYLLQMQQNDGNNGIVFRMALEEGAKLAAGRAYLSTSYAASGARLSIALPNEDEVTSIEGTAPRPKPMPHHATHDLHGRKIGSTTARGIKIVDGKKILR